MFIKNWKLTEDSEIRPRPTTNLKKAITQTEQTIDTTQIPEQTYFKYLKKQIGKTANTGVSLTQVIRDEKWKLFQSQYDLCSNHART